MRRATVPAAGGRVCLGGERFAVAATLADASREVCADRDRRGCGYHAWYGRPGAGEVRDARGKLLARVSYNGRVWEPANERREVTGAALTRAL